MRLVVLLLVLICIQGCDDNSQQIQQDQGLALTERMAAKPKPGFARALQARQFSFPVDHAAHEEYATEWWYFTGNLDDKSGRPFGYQLTLFRVGLEPGKPESDSTWRAHQIYMGHLAISDIQSAKHESAEKFSRAALGLAGAKLNPLQIWLGPWSIKSVSDNTFPLKLTAATEHIGINLTINEGDKPRILQGKAGLSQKSAEPGNASYYYSYTRLPTAGEITINERTYQVAGNSWFDREWSSSALAEDQQGWDWFALQLDDGRDLMFYRMRDASGNAQRFSSGVLVDADGKVTPLSLSNTELEVKGSWQSPAGSRYPVKWRLQVREFGLDLDIQAFFNDQFMQHTVNYWEGAVKVTGSHTGRGYLELSGYSDSS